MIAPVRRALLACQAWPIADAAVAEAAGVTVGGARTYLTMLARRGILRCAGGSLWPGPTWAAWRDSRPLTHVGGSARSYRCRPPSDPRGERSARLARAALLRSTRASAGMSVRGLARAMRVAPSYVRDWESGRCGRGVHALSGRRLRQAMEVLDAATA